MQLIFLASLKARMYENNGGDEFQHAILRALLEI
jgi:hypothetical protein